MYLKTRVTNEKRKTIFSLQCPYRLIQYVLFIFHLQSKMMHFTAKRAPFVRRKSRLLKCLQDPSCGLLLGAASTYMGVFAVGLIALMACHPVGLAGVAMAGLVKAAIPSVFAYKLMAGGAFIGFCGGSIFDKPESDRLSHRPKF